MWELKFKKFKIVYTFPSLEHFPCDFVMSYVLDFFISEFWLNSTLHYRQEIFNIKLHLIFASWYLKHKCSLYLGLIERTKEKEACQHFLQTKKSVNDKVHTLREYWGYKCNYELPFLYLVSWLTSFYTHTSNFVLSSQFTYL